MNSTPSAIRSKLLSALFVSSGALMLVGPKFVQARFAEWNYPHWFRIAVGVWEIEAGVLLCSSRLRRIGMTQLAALLIGAIYTHAKTKGEGIHKIIPAAMLAALVSAATEDR